MTLLNQSVQVPTQIANLFERLRAGQAPDKFTREFLRDIGFSSSNHHAFIPLLKGLGFLTADGTPTQRYREFLDSTKSSKIIGEAVREAYNDVFVIKARPTKADRKLIAGKYKSTYNMSETAADRAAATFLALLELADPSVVYGETSVPHVPMVVSEKAEKEQDDAPPTSTPTRKPTNVGLHYNIQIHLPATKDVEVYNAIFKSLKEHLVD